MQSVVSVPLCNSSARPIQLRILRTPNWSRPHWFYTLFTCAAHAQEPLVGLEEFPRPPLTKESVQRWRSALDELSAQYDNTLRRTRRMYPQSSPGSSIFPAAHDRYRGPKGAGKVRSGSHCTMKRVDLIEHSCAISTRHAVALECVEEIDAAPSDEESENHQADAYTEALFLRAFTAYENDIEEAFSALRNWRSIP